METRKAAQRSDRGWRPREERSLRCGVVLLALSVIVLPGVRPSPAEAAGSTSASPLLVVDVSTLSIEDQLTAAAIEGLANRAGPRVYLVGLHNGQDWATDPSATHWLEAYNSPWTPGSLADLYALGASVAVGLVVWDPAEPTGTQNLATTLAGRDGLIPVSPSVASVLQGQPWSLPVVWDLRVLGLRTNLESVRWGLDHLWGEGVYAFAVWTGLPRNTKAVQPGLRDWAVARHGFVFDADPAADASLVHEILSHFPQGTPVYGFPFFDTPEYLAGGLGINEAIGVFEISAHGQYLIPTTDAANLTVHVAWPATSHKPAWDDHPRQPDANKTYVTFVLSDGDALGAVYTQLWAGRWSEIVNSTVPIGMSISPSMVDLTPAIYQWYVDNLPSHASLVGGPSGVGYAYPSLMPNLDSYLDITKDVMDRSGLRSVWVLDNAFLRSPGPETMAAYVKHLEPSILFSDYLAFEGGLTPNPPAISYSGRVPVVHDIFPQNVDVAVAAIEATVAQQPPGPRFVFVGLNAWVMGPQNAAEVMARLGPGYEAVRPDELAGLLGYLAPPPTTAPTSSTAPPPTTTTAPPPGVSAPNAAGAQRAEPAPIGAVPRFAG